MKCGLAWSVFLSKTIRVITVVKMFCASWVHTKPYSICFLPQHQRQRKCFFFFKARAEKGMAWHSREQRFLDSYRQRQISQSDCEISSNCGKKPVGKTASTSLPWSNSLTAVSCSGLRTISRSSRRIFRRDNAFDRAFSTIFLLRAKTLHCNQCCSLELSFGRLPKILIDVLAFWSNGNGQYPAYWTNKRCWSSVQTVSQLSLPQAPSGFAARFRGFAALLARSNCLNRQTTQAN